MGFGVAIVGEVALAVGWQTFWLGGRVALTELMFIKFVIAAYAIACIVDRSPSWHLASFIAGYM